MKNLDQILEKKSYWFSQIKEDILWHYTSVSVLNEFIKPDGKIYATHSSELNDTEELKIGREKWMEIISNYNYLNKNNKHIFEYIENTPCVNQLKNNTFIFSLTSQRDSNYHWENYGDNQQGIAIGFNVKKLQNVMRFFAEELWKREPLEYPVTFVCRAPVNYSIHCDYCIYDYGKMQEYISTFLKKLPLEEKDDVLRVLQLCFYRENIIYNLKTSQWNDDKEVRIIYSGPELKCNAEFIGEKLRIPLFLSADLVEEVMISPYGNIISTLEKTYKLRQNYNLSFKVLKSSL